ncbi:hypothetical protein [uncultured Bacteroides sp.]|uniref:hypothetical protein n=1 Tax=uncultured Bacteroides sp. TaxID=162156 RepID=UPI0025DB3ED9|nr:hypothetical protein [uncultured Bacteroides sp.]
MKTKLLCKILLAVSFLFLIPNFCLSKDLEGIWMLISSKNTSKNIRYKVFDKQGNYYNLDAIIKNAQSSFYDVPKRNSKILDVLYPYKITRSGSYHIIAKGLYYEKTKFYCGNPTREAQIPISYRIEKDKLILLFQLGDNVYREVYQKVSSLKEKLY